MPALTNLRIADYPAFLAMAPHMHEFPSMGIVIAGGFSERIGKSDRDYSRGIAAFVPAGVTHAQRFGAAGARQIIFQPRESWLDYLAESRTALADAPHLGDVAFRNFGDRLLRELRQPDKLSGIACEGILLEIVAAFGRSGATETRRGRPPAWLERAREYLRENASSPLRIGDVAEAAGRHEVHLAHEFRRFYGTTVGTYLRQLRTESAARLLADPDADICQVALDCGFSSHSHLCREFKLRFGVTPSQYRADRNS
jgi:AraC family transcriptional regulator